MKRLLLMSFLFLSIHPAKKPNKTPSMYRSEYDFRISMLYEHDFDNHKSRIEAKVNEMDFACHCGQGPSIIIIVYGHVQGFCSKHLPQIVLQEDIYGEKINCA